jgi:uncharacterized protein
VITVVLDANVLASGFAGFLLPASTPGELLRRWRQRAFDLVLSEHILAELERTLTDPYFRRRLGDEQIAADLSLLRRAVPMVSPVAGVSCVASHAEDDVVLATAMAVQPAYLITGDAQLQKLRRYREVIILSPRAFLDLLNTQQPT